MNWKTLLVITSLTLSAGLTSCGKEAEAPKTDGGAPAATEAPKGEMKPSEAPKGEMKPGETKKEAPKKP